VQLPGDALALVLDDGAFDLFTDDLCLLGDPPPEQRGPDNGDQRQGADETESPDKAAERPPRRAAEDGHVIRVAEVQAEAVDRRGKWEGACGRQFTNASEPQAIIRGEVLRQRGPIVDQGLEVPLVLAALQNCFVARAIAARQEIGLHNDQLGLLLHNVLP
jgi:hypothetical protein